MEAQPLFDVTNAPKTLPPQKMSTPNPGYHQTQSSDSYKEAKSLLASNDLQGCMDMTEGMLKSTLDAVQADDNHEGEHLIVILMKC